MASASTLLAQIEVTSTGAGIGTATPTQKLQVNGNAIVGSAGSLLLHYSTFVAQGNPFIEIKGNAQSDYGIPQLLFSAGGRTTNRQFGANLSFGSSDYTTDDKRGASLSVYYSGASYTNADMAFFTRDGATSSIAERMRILYDGKVGIGTSTPGAALHVRATDAVTNGLTEVLRLDHIPASGAAGAAGIGSELAFYSVNATPYYYRGAGISHIQTNVSPGNEENALAFRTYSMSNGGWGEVMRIQGGRLGIGTTAPTHKLTVTGSVRATSFIADVNTYADFVFKPGYRLAPLTEVEAHIVEKGHLPGIPSEAEARENGIDVVEMQVKLLQKIEEITLHQIAQEKELAALKAENAVLREALLAR